MNNTIKNLIALVVVMLIGLIIPSWYALIPVGLILGYLADGSIMKSGLMAFLIGLVGWSMWAFYSDVLNDSILSARLGGMFGGIGSIGLIFISGIVGALILSSSAMFGRSIASMRDLGDKNVEK